MPTPEQNRRCLVKAVVCLMLAFAVLIILPGCGGCSKDPLTPEELEKKRAKELAEKKKKEEEEKPPFQLAPLKTRPSDRRTAGGNDNERAEFTLGPPYKPGHWTSTVVAARANHAHFLGELETVATDRQGKPIPLPAVSYDMTSTRQVTLQKGKAKAFESVLFVPDVDHQARVSYGIRSGSGGGLRRDTILSPMPSYQYHFVVLARRADRYNYLQGLATLRPPSDDFIRVIKPYYRLSLMQADRANMRLALPSQPLMWTGIACVLWDDATPEALNLDQQLALLDWLHWGGQLILSGPETLDTLRDSFLAPYLPATAGETTELTADAFEPLSEWSNQGKSNSKPQLPLEPIRPLQGVTLKMHPDAEFMEGSGRLIAERRIGSGRIVVTAFRLSGLELTSWPGLDELYNAFLLRRPARRFKQMPIEAYAAAAPPPSGFNQPWNSPAAGNAADESLTQVVWADRKKQPLDAQYVTQLRYFTRDADTTLLDRRDAQGALISRGYGPDTQSAGLEWNEQDRTGPGLAAWNDYNPVSNAARQTLSDAARIEIPDRMFVFWMVGGYLVILVPINWIVFRAIGRVEWAWVAAPLIAIAGTAAVIRMAQLDIGFVRSRTEVSVIEIQGEYPRAHVTRYIALYTSLGTSYDFQFEDPGALIQPFPSVKRPEQFERYDQRTVVYRQAKKTDLLNVFVRSNNTGFMHSEEMVELGGGITLSEEASGRFQIVNRTGMTLHDAQVFRGDGTEEPQIARLGLFEPDEKRLLQFTKRAEESESDATGSSPESPEATSSEQVRLNPTRLVNVAERVVGPRDGELCLLATVRHQIPGLAIDPPAKQFPTVLLVVAHLSPGNETVVEADVNVRPAETNTPAEETAQYD